MKNFITRLIQKYMDNKTVAKKYELGTQVFDELKVDVDDLEAQKFNQVKKYEEMIKRFK